MNSTRSEIPRRREITIVRCIVLPCTCAVCDIAKFFISNQLNEWILVRDWPELNNINMACYYCL